MYIIKRMISIILSQSSIIKTITIYIHINVHNYNITKCNYTKIHKTSHFLELGCINWEYRSFVKLLERNFDIF